MTARHSAEPGRVASVDDEQLQGLLDREACANVMKTYCRSIDHQDEALLRSLFHEDSWHRHGFEGPSSAPEKRARKGQHADFVGFALATLATHTHTHHQLGNILVELEADGVTAFTEAYFTAFHRMRPAGDPKAAGNAFDTEMDFWVGGRYMDRMDKRNNVWKIVYRVGTTDWQRIEAPSSQGLGDRPADLQSLPNRSDLVYRRRNAFVRPKK